jgi:putative lipoic acid-binding regulatory protein
VTQQYPELEDLVDFPTLFTFRALAAPREGLLQACQQAAEATLGRGIDEINERPSKNARWVSVRISIQVISAEEIRSTYAAIHAVDGVKMML